MLKLVNSNLIYNYPDFCGFGDAWAVTNYLLQISEKIRMPVRFFSVSLELKRRIKSIQPFINSDGEIEIVNQPPQKVLRYCDPFLIEFKPTYKTWEFRSNIIAYQFDGIHLFDKKNLPLIRLKFLLGSLYKMGYVPVDLGHKKDISFIVDTLAQCKLFVGCPSGISIVARNVGTPIHLITRMLHPNQVKFLRRCQYHGTSVQMYRTVDEFLNRSCTNWSEPQN